MTHQSHLPLDVERGRQPYSRDEESPSLVEKLHGEDCVKVIGGREWSLTFVASFSSGLVRALVANPRP